MAERDHRETELAFEALRAGNARYAAGCPTDAGLPEHRPLAVVISCSDARVSVGRVFDQPPGALFVVRTAGHVLEPAALASVVYAAAELGVRLVVVLGHQACGAVGAAVAGADDPALQALVAPISERLAAAESVAGVGVRDGDESGAIHANATQAAVEVREHLRATVPIVAGDVTVRAGFTSLETGEVAWLDTPGTA